MKKNLLSQLNFSLDVVKAFDDYAKDLDVYFSIEENQKNNLELFKYYNDLKNKMLALATKYGVKK